MRNNYTSNDRVRFYTALAASDLDAVQTILWDFPNLRTDIDPETGETPILKVCKTDDIEMATILLRGDDSIYADLQGNPPLNVACIHNKVEMAKFLISRDVNVNLTSASSWFQLDDGRIKEIVGKTALEIAYENSNADLIRILEPLTDPRIRKRITESEMEKLLQERKILEVEKAEFAKKKAEFEAGQAEFEKDEKEREERVDRQLIKVSKEKIIQEFAAILQGGVNIFDKIKKEISVNAHDKLGNTLLHHIAKRSEIQLKTAEIFKGIIDGEEFNPKLNLTNKAAETPLITACRFGNFVAANILLDDPRVDFRAEARDGWTALHYCAANKCSKSFEVASRIIEQVDVDFLNKKAGSSEINEFHFSCEVNALHLSCRAGDSNLAALLIDSGAEYAENNAAHKSPETIMREWGGPEDVKKMDAAILRAVCRKGDYDSAVELIKKGVSYTMEGNNGDSAVKIMKKCGGPEDKEKMTAAIREVIAKKIASSPSASIIPNSPTEKNVKKLSATDVQQSQQIS